MQTPHIHLTVAQVKAILPFASTDAARLAIMNIQFDRNLAIATNGYCMLVMDIGTKGEFKPFGVPAYQLKDAISKGKAKQFIDITIDGDMIQITQAARPGAVKHVKSVIDYPDWRRVVPKACTDEATEDYNSDYLAMFRDAAQHLECGCHVIRNGKEGAFVSFSKHVASAAGQELGYKRTKTRVLLPVFGVLMPVRRETPFSVAEMLAIGQTLSEVQSC